MFRKHQVELEKKHGFRSTPTGFYGVVAGQFVQLHKESSAHRVRIGFVLVDEALRHRFEALKQKLKIFNITYSEKWVRAEFRDLLPGRRFQKIESLLTELVSIGGPRLLAAPTTCVQCGTSEDILVFRHDVSLMPLCSHCAEEISNSLRNDEERFRNSPHRYIEAFSAVFVVLALFCISLVWSSRYIGDLTLILSLGSPLIALWIFRQLRGKPGRLPGAVLTLLSTASIGAIVYLSTREFGKLSALYSTSFFGTKYLAFLSQDDPIVYSTMAAALFLIVWLFGPLLSFHPKFYSLENVGSARKQET